MDGPWKIRAATSDDLDAIVAIERASFSDPWSRASLAEAMGSSLAIPLVAEADRQGIGYAIARVIRDQAEILTVGVLPEARRGGVGRALIAGLLTELRRRGVEEVWLEVRVSNLPARELYRSFGFRPGGMRRAYYRQPKEDALVLRLTLAAGSA